MKKAIKFVIMSVFAFLIIFSAFPSLALAESKTDYEPRLTAPNSSISYYNREKNVYSQCGYSMPNCTAYAFGRIYELTGEKPLITKGDASAWWRINKNKGYYDYGSTPKLGAVACWSNHVAVVEVIDGNKITISQSHWGGNYFDTETLTSGSNRYGQKFYGYIYMYQPKEEVTEKEDEKVYKIEKSEYITAKTDEISLNQFSIVNNIEQKAPTEKILINSKMLDNAINK